MGTRMHLVVGYGLDLIQLPKLDKSHLSSSVLEDTQLWEKWRDDVLRFALEHEARHEGLMEKIIFHENMNPPTDLYQLSTYDSEFGDPNLLVLTPSASREQWRRYGNLLDAFLYEAQEEDSLDLSMEPEWMPHPGTLYPYTGLMKANPDMPLGVEKYWVSCYKNHPEHKNALAWAPWHLWFWLRTVFGLSDEDTTEAFLALRPGVYRYWS